MIDETRAFKLIRDYTNGWKSNNPQLILDCLTDDVVVIESHGTTYNGIRAIENWLKVWNESQGKISKWDITSINFCQTNQVAFFEWEFSCTVSNKEYALLGINLVKFSHDKINFIHEYKMSKPPYNWDQAKLDSE